MSYTIRRAMPSDAPTLTDCIKAAYAEYARQGIDLPPVSEGVLMDIRDNDVWVAADGAHILGGVILSTRGETADLMNIAVHPGAAGRGVGRALMQAALKAARAAGHTTADLATHRDMPQNVALYEHLGWNVTRREGVKVHMSFDLDQPPGSAIPGEVSQISRQCAS